MVYTAHVINSFYDENAKTTTLEMIAGRQEVKYVVPGQINIQPNDIIEFYGALPSRPPVFSHDTYVCAEIYRGNQIVGILNAQDYRQ